MYRGEGKGGPDLPKGEKRLRRPPLLLMNSEEEPKPNDNISLFVHSSTPLSLIFFLLYFNKRIQRHESREYLLLIPIQSLIPPQPILLYA